MNTALREWRLHNLQRSEIDRRLLSTPEGSIAKAAMGVGIHPPSRPLTLRERLVVALARARPFARLDFTSADFTYEQAHSAWRALVKRVERRLSKNRSKRPWIYAGCIASAYNLAGHHLHMLVFDYIALEWLVNPNARAVGFGLPHLTKLSA